eukprot:SAG31_NODE_5226_length_2662_cov_1.657956_3_plen_70_part_00
MHQGKFVLLTGENDLLLILGGDDEHDELGLLEIGQAVLAHLILELFVRLSFVFDRGRERGRSLRVCGTR